VGRPCVVTTIPANATFFEAAHTDKQIERESARAKESERKRGRQEEGGQGGRVGGSE
jgi:hypothetical protein